MSLCRIFLVLLIFVLPSCASKKPIDFEDKDNSGIAEAFNLKNGRLEKFKVERAQVDSESESDFPDVEAALEAPTPKPPVLTSPPSRPDKQTPERPPVLKPTADVIAGQIPDIDDDEEDDTEDEKDELVLKSGKKKKYPAAFLKYDKVSKELWAQANPVYYPNEEKVFAIKYLGITAAHIRMTSRPLAKIGGEEAFHYVAQLKSARFYERIYKMDDTVETFVSTEDFLPIRYTLVQRESSQNVDDLQIFDHENKKTFFWYKRDRKGQIKKEEKEAFIPGYFQDTFSSMFFARGLPMEIGANFEFPIVTRTRLWLLKMKVETKENIRVMGNTRTAFRLEAETRLPSELSKKPGKITIWVSADERKELLKFKANVKFGSIEGELQEYKPGSAAYVKASAVAK